MQMARRPFMAAIWATKAGFVKRAAKMPFYLRKAQALVAAVPFSLTF
jgi:hypothetical protein